MRQLETDYSNQGWERNQRERSEYTREFYRIKQRNEWIERYAARIVLAMFIIGMVLGTVASCGALPEPACADGSTPTEWCGCLPPVYGGDC